MHHKIITTAVSLVLAAVSFPASAAETIPAKVGDCARTGIASTGKRLEDASTHKPMPDSGSVVTLTNGLILISYDAIPAIDKSRRGDPILVCLVSVPNNCPPGDNRGKFYTATNLRRVESWTLPDSQHMCGGA